MSHKKTLVLLTLLFANLYICRGWSWAGDTIDVDNAVLNLGLFNEGSGDASEEGTKEMARMGSQNNQESSLETMLNTQSTLINEDSNFVKQYDNKAQWTKGDKGEPGETGQKGECVKEFSVLTEPIGSCSCNISQLVDNYGDILKGLKGDIGPRGYQGPPGVPGPPGPPGLPSSHGREGSFDALGGLMDPSLTYMGGRMSEPGPPGPRGLPGHKGEKGNQGVSIKGDKGERGKRGKTGKPGIRGPPGAIGLPGPKGEDVRIADIKRLMLENDIKGVKGDTGSPGLPGPPGPPGPVLFDSWSDNSLTSRSRHYRGKMYDRMASGDTVYIEGPPGPPGQKGESGTASGTNSTTSSVLIMKDIEQLQQATLTYGEGTLAFVLSEQSLLVRVKNGWQYITLANTLTQPQGISLIKTTSNEDAISEPSAAIVAADNTNSEISRHVTHNRKLRMAALNQPFTGDIHGVRGADYECFRQSRRANLKGTFRAFIASRTQNLDSIVRLKDSKLPVVNLRDEILFNSWRDLFTGAGAPFPYPPKIYSFDGRNIFTDATWSQKLIWHGADRDGVRNTDAYCDAWGSNVMSRMGVASNLLRGKLLDQEKYSCNNAFIVLCVEVTPEESSSRHRRQSGHSSH